MTTSTIVTTVVTTVEHKGETKSLPTCKGCKKCHHGFTGSGCLIVTKNDRTGDTDIVLARVRRSTGKRYFDFGGKIDAGERCSDTASRELFEESCRTINIKATFLQKCSYVDIVKKGCVHKYRCYVVLCLGVSCKTFYQAIKNPGLPSRLKETDAMTRFQLGEIKANYIANKGVLDVLQKADSGTHKPLSSRARHIIEQCIENHLL